MLCGNSIFLRGKIFSVLLLAASLTTSGAHEVRAEGSRQGLYNACVKLWNSYTDASGRKAMVIGVSYRADGGWRGTCFSRTGAGSIKAAREAAFDDCRSQYSNCQIFAEDYDLVSWAREISDNGGRDPNDVQRTSNSSSFFNGLMQGLVFGSAAALGASRSQAPSYRTPSQRLGGGSPNCEGGGHQGSCAFR